MPLYILFYYITVNSLFFLRNPSCDEDRCANQHAYTTMYRQREEGLDACRMLSKTQLPSHIVRKGISTMMDIVQKHWYHAEGKQRPDLWPNVTHAFTQCTLKSRGL
ncbi:hypothetical protein BDV18DRAFT_143794 [Aspergillus unguis]